MEFLEIKVLDSVNDFWEAGEGSFFVDVLFPVQVAKVLAVESDTEVGSEYTLALNM